MHIVQYNILYAIEMHLLNSCLVLTQLILTMKPIWWPVLYHWPVLHGLCTHSFVFDLPPQPGCKFIYLCISALPIHTCIPIHTYVHVLMWDILFFLTVKCISDCNEPAFPDSDIPDCHPSRLPDIFRTSFRITVSGTHKCITLWAQQLLCPVQITRILVWMYIFACVYVLKCTYGCMYVHVQLGSSCIVITKYCNLSGLVKYRIMNYSHHNSLIVMYVCTCIS